MSVLLCGTFPNSFFPPCVFSPPSRISSTALRYCTDGWRSFFIRITFSSKYPISLFFPPGLRCVGVCLTMMPTKAGRACLRFRTSSQRNLCFYLSGRHGTRRPEAGLNHECLTLEREHIFLCSMCLLLLEHISFQTLFR